MQPEISPIAVPWVLLKVAPDIHLSRHKTKSNAALSKPIDDGAAIENKVINLVLPMEVIYPDGRISKVISFVKNVLPYFLNDQYVDSPNEYPSIFEAQAQLANQYFQLFKTRKIITEAQLYEGYYVRQGKILSRGTSEKFQVLPGIFTRGSKYSEVKKLSDLTPIAAPELQLNRMYFRVEVFSGFGRKISIYSADYLMTLLLCGSFAKG